ncbi:MAG: hypothetical protein JNL96_19890 [Planctomycetaceae bacterium]|nr:hypothetical protein [Planctomycetaceae bacterium]
MDTPAATIELIRRIHASPPRVVLAVTGGGSRAFAKLLAVPGASQTVLEAIVPYCPASLTEFLSGRPEQFCSSATARAMAMAAYRRALKYRDAGGDDEGGPQVLGLGLTASLASDRPKRGPHRLHWAAQSANRTWSCSLQLTKDARTRDAEEDVAAAVLIDLLAEACGIAERPPIELLPGETIERRRTDALPSWVELFAGRIARTCERPAFPGCDGEPRAIFPGSFRPLHDGHRRMAEIAARELGCPVDFELSIENVEKPPLDFEEMQTRGGQFAPATRIWYTRAPRMVQKAALFPGATIVCGLDTLLRVADARFADDSDAERERIVAEIKRLGCRFLVFGRAVDGKFQTLDDVTIPESLRRISMGVPEAEFRDDVSSTELRKYQS